MIYDAVDTEGHRYLPAPSQSVPELVVEPVVVPVAVTVRASRSGRMIKRVLDIGLAGLALVVLAPVLVVITAAIWLSSAGGPLFGQERVGRGGRVFRCWKFRSMRRDAEQILQRDPELYATYVANDFKLDCDDDPRITAIGRVLRKTSLDELPQLVNVLIGHMSLVGPRPVVPFEIERCYGPWMGEYLAVRPGITGSWQITGRNDIHYPERAAIDAHYVNTWTLRHDLSILARTPIALLRGTPGARDESAEVIALHGAHDRHAAPSEDEYGASGQ